MKVGVTLEHCLRQAMLPREKRGKRKGPFSTPGHDALTGYTLTLPL